MVVSGLYRGYTKKTEIWPKPKTQCALANFPHKVSGAVGFRTALGPTICGGLDKRREKRCFVYKQHQWIPFPNLKTSRQYASAIEVNIHETLIIGGEDENRNDLKSTELITSFGSEAGKNFPLYIHSHCSFKINSTHGLVTGGNQDRSVTASTWYVELFTSTFTRGPKMKLKRMGHGCATFHHGSKTYGIASGGSLYPNHLKSTEFIDLDQDSPTWTEGKQEKKIV